MNKGNAGRLSTSTGLKFTDTVINPLGATFDEERAILAAIDIAWEAVDDERMIPQDVYIALATRSEEAGQEIRDAEHYALEGGWQADEPEDREHPETVIERAQEAVSDLLEALPALTGNRLEAQWIEKHKTLRIIRRP